MRTVHCLRGLWIEHNETVVEMEETSVMISVGTVALLGILQVIVTKT